MDHFVRSGVPGRRQDTRSSVKDAMVPDAGLKSEERFPLPVSIDIRRAGAAIVFSARGRLNNEDVLLLDQLLTDLVVGQGNRTVVVDTTSLVPSDEVTDLFRRFAASAAGSEGEFTVHPPSTGRAIGDRP